MTEASAPRKQRTATVRCNYVCTSRSAGGSESAPGRYEHDELLAREQRQAGAATDEAEEEPAAPLQQQQSP